MMRDHVERLAEVPRRLTALSEGMTSLMTMYVEDVVYILALEKASDDVLRASTCDDAQELEKAHRILRMVRDGATYEQARGIKEVQPWP